MVERGHACIEAAQPQRCPLSTQYAEAALSALRPDKSTTVDNGGTGIAADASKR